MNPRKKIIKDHIIRIITERSDNPVQSFNQLKRRIIETLNPQYQQSEASLAEIVFGNTPEKPELSEEDWALFSESYWDLFFERIITPGLDPSNPQIECFRLHSESLKKRLVS